MIDTLEGFTFGPRTHIFECYDPAGDTHGACGIVVKGRVETSAVEADGLALCRSCLLVVAERDWVEEPMAEAEARGVELVASFGPGPDEVQP